MVAADQEPSAPPAAGYLEVLITRPDPEMRGCKAWSEFCLLEAFVGDAHVARKVLPIARGNVVLEKKEMEDWMLHLRIPVGLDWPTLSLDLLVRRIDYVPVQEGEDRKKRRREEKEGYQPRMEGTLIRIQKDGDAARLGGDAAAGGPGHRAASRAAWHGEGAHGHVS